MSPENPSSLPLFQIPQFGGVFTPKVSGGVVWSFWSFPFNLIYYFLLDYSGSPSGPVVDVVVPTSSRWLEGEDPKGIPSLPLVFGPPQRGVWTHLFPWVKTHLSPDTLCVLRGGSKGKFFLGEGSTFLSPNECENDNRRSPSGPERSTLVWLELRRRLLTDSSHSFQVPCKKNPSGDKIPHHSSVSLKTRVPPEEIVR